MTRIILDIQRIIKQTSIDKRTNFAENYDTASNCVFLRVYTKRTLKISRFIEFTIRTTTDNLM